MLRRTVPSVQPWPWDVATDTAMDGEDGAAAELHGAEQGLAKAAGKARRAAARVAEAAEAELHEAELQERATHWNARLADQQQRVQMVVTKKKASMIPTNCGYSFGTSSRAALLIASMYHGATMGQSAICCVNDG